MKSNPILRWCFIEKKALVVKLSEAPFPNIIYLPLDFTLRFLLFGVAHL